MLPNQLEEKTSAAADYILERFPHRPRFGIILGTGSGELANAIETEIAIDYAAIPHFPSSTAIGHRGQLVCGTLAGANIIAMQGRFHLYEGYHVDLATLPVHVMHQLGVEILFISNASGGLNPKFFSGEIMILDSHIDLMFRSTPNLFATTTLGRPSILSDQYDRTLAEQALECARAHNFVLHRGVYASLLGPNYETRAEYRMLRRIGADAAGMSTTPEVSVASKNGIRVMEFSIITNVAKPDVLGVTTAEEVIQSAETAAPNLTKLVTNAVIRN